MLRYALGIAFAVALLTSCGVPSGITAGLIAIENTSTNAAPAIAQAGETATSAPASTPTPLFTPSETPAPAVITIITPTPVRALTCEDVEFDLLNPDTWLLLHCGSKNTLGQTPTVTTTRSITHTNGITGTVSLTATRVVVSRPRPTATSSAPPVLTQLVQDKVVTAMYMNPQGDLYFGAAESPRSIADPFDGHNALWKKPANGDLIQLTPYAYNQIGGITTHGGYVYFSAAGSLRRIADANNTQEAEAVIIYPMITKGANLPYGHINHALANYNLNGKEVLLMAVGSLLDSAYPGQGVPPNIQAPYYEDFPTGRINYATFDWLDSTHEFIAQHGVADQFDEFARGVRNPWGMTVGTVNGKQHIFAIDNDPAFTPEKYDSNPANSGDELNDILYHTIYGHPYLYGGAEPALGFTPPVITFPDGSVPSGVAVAAGKVFVSLHDARMVVKVDLDKHTWTPVLTDIEPFSLLGAGNGLYIGEFNGIKVIDASRL